MRILIAGAGIAGLAVALALHNRGIAFEIVEREAGGTERGAGMYLPGNTVRALDRLGVLAQVRKMASPIDVQQIFDNRGRLLNEVDLASFWQECGGCLSLSRAALQRIFADELTHVPTRYGISIESVRQDSAGAFVTFSDGTQSTYDVVIGADGIQSSVRRSVFGQLEPWDLGIASWRTIIENRFGITGWTAMLGPKRTLLAIPVEKRRLYIYADIAAADGAYNDGNPAQILRELFSSFAGPLRPIVDRLDGIESIHTGRLREIPAQMMHEGRVVLIGDAAHATSPSMAQGAGMALEDALVLADALGHAKNAPAALEAYSTRRLDRVWWVQQQSRKRDKVRSLPEPVRNFVLGRFGTGLYAKSFGPLIDEI